MKKALIIILAAILVTLSSTNVPLVAAAEEAEAAGESEAAALTLGSTSGDTEGKVPSGLSYSEAAEALNAYLEKNKGNRAAVATAVFSVEGDILTRCFGAIDQSGTPLDENCVLEWGSVTKLTVWVSAMQLAAVGRLDLNADIGTYLPQGFLKNLNFEDEITMLNLMNHNAGFQETDFVLEVYSPDDIIPLGEYLAEYQPAQVFAPGEVTAYSNWGAALAGYIVECISGKPFWKYVNESIFAPLGMEHSAIAPDLSDNEWVRERRAAFESVTPDGDLEPENKAYILPYPAGSCVSTLSDFALFAKALLTKDERLLSAEGFELLYSPSSYYTGTDHARTAHGFLVDYDFAFPIVGHDGNTAGGSSRLLLDLQNGIGMVMLTNQLGGSVYRTGMAKLIFGEGDNHAQIDGYYVPARNVFSGPSKLTYNLFLIDHCHITSRLADGLYVNVLPDRLEISMTDYLRQPSYSGDKEASDLLWDYRLYDTLAVIWYVALIYALVNLLVRIVIAIVFAVKKHRQSLLNLLGGAYSLMLVLTCVPVYLHLPAAAYTAYIVLTGMAGIALAVYTVCARGRYGGTKAGIASLWQTRSLLICFAIAVVNAVIWDLLI